MPELRKRPAPKDVVPPPEAKRSANRGRAVGSAVSSTSTTATVEGKGKAKGKGKGKGGIVEITDGHGDGHGDETTKSGDEALTTSTSAAPDTVEKLEESIANVRDAEVDGKGMATGPLSAESVGKKINLAGLGGVVKTHSGTEVTLAELVGKSENTKGVVVFTYPKASTPGCTTQACLFRDSYKILQDAGLGIYGLSGDSPKANTTFVTKQKLPFELLCDPEAGLTGALGLKKSVGKGTLRGSVVISKQGIIEVWNQAGPAKTLEAVTVWIDGRK